MRFRMLSQCGQGLALLNRLQDDGYECEFWTPPNIPADLYEDIIPRTDDWHDGLDEETVVLFDAPGSGKLATDLPLTWGASPINDVLHFDRTFGLKIAKIHGLKIPAYGRFNATAPAAEFLSGCKESRWGLELPNGVVFYEDQSGRQMCELLEFTEPLTDFYLVERVPGESLSLSGWYVGGELVPNSLFSTVEKNRFLAGDYGPRCPTAQLCTGWFWPPKRKRDGETTPTLYRHTLKKLEPWLKQEKYQGPLCLRLRIGETDGIPSFYGFETGFRYPAIYAMLEGLEVDLADVISTMVAGEKPELKPTRSRIGAMAISVPPYPYFAGRANHLVRGNLDAEHVWPLDVKCVAGCNFTAGAQGIVAYLTAQAEKDEELAGNLHELADTVNVADKQLRDDGPDAGEVIELLTNWHYF